VEVLVGHADVPFLTGRSPGTPPDLADWERAAV
jgi:hypothetical protein